MKIITVHGIRMKNRWYETFPVMEEIKSNNVEVIPFYYSYFSFFKFCRKSQRQKILDQFCDFYSQTVKNNERPSVVGHSFGTYLIYQAMKKYDVIKFDNIIFCGSILHEKTDFRPLLKNNQFNILKNDHGQLEWYLKYTKILDQDCGQAGKTGFLDIPFDQKNRIINSNNYKSHSEYFLPLHIEKNWIPFLLSNLKKFDYKEEILQAAIIDRIYENIKWTKEVFSVNEISFNARIDKKGNYYGKYVKKGVNETESIIDYTHFSTTGDGFHNAEEMGFSAYTLDDVKLSHVIDRDINHHKSFKVNLEKPVKKGESIGIKYFFCWYNTINTSSGDTDHWSISGIRNINIFLNFPSSVNNPRLFVVKNRRVVDQLILNVKREKDGTVSYSYHFSNQSNSEGLVFYFEGLNNDDKQSQRKFKDIDFKLKGRRVKYTITKASQNDIKRIYKIEVDIEMSNAASERVLELRRLMFNEGFLVLKQNGNVIGYLESVVWNEKRIEKFSEISNFPLQYNINGRELYIIFLAVDKRHRRRGLATRLLSEIEGVARRNSLGKICLVAKGDLVSMYANLNYRAIRSLPNFLEGQDHQSVLMEKELEI